MKIVFVCTGNTCRSAMAHKLLEKRAKEMNKDIEVYSCGITASDGNPATNTAIEAMKEYNIDLTSHRTTNIGRINMDDMDVILCATAAHRRYVVDIYPDLRDRAYTIKEYAGYDPNDLDINDPWGWGIETYRKCVAQIEESIEKIISAGKL